ncbi:uncharacterized protein FJT64_027123 [Amphibalanus amphitrite]|uniref:Uncharacterized protein n=1 Tax=Amphibalanus amphitrite TaxID=1232801 RepID=A0A6A4W4Y2_AMPAM|nr:uncharacterized protein FJT64_003961 [Amphibalanus amphitrite]KAF0300369.1 uncharacterized protein FJT64_027123 [Amphibalanus amphitrite]
MHSRRSGSPNMDPLQAMRRMDFPYCVHEALKKLDQIVHQEPTRLRPIQPFVQLLINEFIIFDGTGNSKFRRNLNNVQNLQLLEVLGDYFSLPNSEAARVMAFMVLFQPVPGPEGAAGRRVSLLCRLVSLAVSTRNSQVLSCAGAWLLQQQGCTSAAALRLAESLLEDHLLPLPPPPSSSGEETPDPPAADSLPELAPLFTAGLLTALTHLYRDLRSRPPPPELISQVLRWLESSPSLPLVPLSGTGPVPLPSSAPPPAAACPAAGLMTWSVLSAAVGPSQTVKGADQMARLHLLLLTCLLEVPRLRPQSGGRPALLTHGQLTRLVTALESAGLGADQPPAPHHQLALDRMAQLFQVALAVEGLGHNKRESLQQLSRLRQTPLIRIVLQHNS